MTQIQQYVTRGVTLLILSVFTLPLFVGTSFYFPFITLRNFAFRLLVGILLAGLTYLYLSQSRRATLPTHKILYSFFVLALSLTFSSLLGGDFLYGLWSTYERMEGLMNLYYVVAFLVILIVFLREEREWLTVFRFTVLVSYGISFIALSQYAGATLLISSGGGERVSSTLGNATYLATYALFHLFFALVLVTKKLNDLSFEIKTFAVLDTLLLVLEFKTGILQTIFTEPILALLFIVPQGALLVHRYAKSEVLKHKGVSLFFIVLAIMNFFALYNTQTRGALVGFIVSVFFMLFLSFFLYRGSKNIQKTAIVVLLFAVVSAGIFVFYKDSSFIQDRSTLRRLANISLDDTTTKTRLLTWEAAYLGWKEKPLVGWGEEKFYVVFNKHFPQEIYKHVSSRVWFDRPHNVFLQPLIHGGIIGFAAYMSILLFAFHSLFTYRKHTGNTMMILLLIGLLVAYMVQNAFVFDSLNSYILLVLFLGYIIFLTKKKTDDTGTAGIAPKLSVYSFVTPVFIILFATYFLNVPYIKANLKAVEGIQQFNQAVVQNRNVLESAEALIGAFNQTYLGRYELRQTFAEQVAGIIEQRRLPDDVSLQLGKLAEDEMLKSIESQSDNVRHYAFLTNLYLNMSRLDQSYIPKNLVLLEDALPLSPTRTHFYYSQGRSYINMQNQPAALASFEKAVELSPKVFDAHLNLFAAYATFELIDRAQAHIEAIPQLLERDITVAEYSKLGEVFQLLGNFSNAITLLESVLVDYPDDILLLRQIAVYYAHVGEHDKAREAASRVLALDPSFEDEYNTFIEQL